MFSFSFTPVDISPPCSGSVLFLKSVNHHLNLVSSFRPVLRRGKLCGSCVRVWNCLHYMLQCFSNGLEHIKLKMNSGSSRHHVARCLSLHFPFSGCSIMTTAVTFIACVCLCLCAYTVFGPYAWEYLYLCDCARLLSHSRVRQPSIKGHVLRQKITSVWLLLEGKSCTSICFSMLIQIRKMYKWCSYSWFP